MAAATASHLLMPPIRCADSKPTRRGFGTKNNTNKVPTKSTTKQSGPVPTQAPGLSSQFDGKSKNNSLDLQFEERLEAVRRSALEKKKEDDEKDFGAIDYDAPVEAEKKTIGLGTQIGVGVAVLVFGLVFALGDFLPSGRYGIGAAVTLTELGEYTRAVSVLQDLTKVKPSDPDVYRLLGEVKYELKDYDGSVAAFKISDMVSKEINFEVLRGLTTSLLAAKKPDEAVQFLLGSRERLYSQNSNSKVEETNSQQVDPVQVELLLGKAYSDWGHISDAVSVYDRLISSHPDDFRGYLAKGIILKENGKVGDAERMFIQARFFAPEKAKALVDRYSRR
ncbi:uncharacterized protein LOC126727650 isoform X4 [Quercus robur]|uniref:uncharacterized protein LOC126727650 isoform X4 n=1 Tax=Quercus robur TaxID=38942 RepID=UPI002161637F|nr:uncharacterized protein LOC126727650 isoform X4 [Quercus robur]